MLTIFPRGMSKIHSIPSIACFDPVLKPSDYVMPALDVDVEELKRIFDVNLFGTVRVTQAFSTPLINRKGIIVNVGSLAAYAPYVFGSSYNASKAALLAFGNTLRIELSPWR